MPNQSPLREAVTAELATLPGCSIQVLRRRWGGLFRSEPPQAFGPDLLRRGIAQKLQESAYGALSPTTQRELNRAIASLAKNPSARLELPRRIKPGAVLVRDWKAKSHRVMVLDEGFAYEGRAYPSLSEIARKITGTRWNGPKFFGLRPADRPRVENKAGLKRQPGAGAADQQSNRASIDTPPRRRGRPRKVATTETQSTQAEASHGH